ncbi:F-box/RNI-like superfamily protein [Artemisia annua]|uniref:F-box/RNI-like superfamily protein n=1 Tax=Artemisia annua TaxID=35608 RepID=A0A2U1KDK8_ARTAN|nr:F-box/RNI-like superfamily protein [Artemisia annua]
MNHSSSINVETKPDIISNLPQTLLTHILSLLPDVDACRTSILSKRWRDLRMFLPNLHLVMPTRTREQVDKFYDLIDKTLAIRGGMSIQKFFLYYCSEQCDYDRVLNWLRIAVQCKVEILVLKFLTKYPIHRGTVMFCWDLFKTCNTLVELTLEGEIRLNVPKADILFPRLKKISLIESTSYISYESFENLITGCPVLEELSLQGYEPTDNLRKLRDPLSQSFKRLKICSVTRKYATSKFDVLIHEYRYMQDYCIFPTHIAAKPLSFVEVYNRITTGPFRYLVSYIAQAKILTLTNSSLEALVFHGLDKCTLSNVVTLTIDNISNWNSLLVLLNSVPNLEHITFSDGISHNNMSWNPPMEPPACLCLKMKEIIILNRKTVSYEEFAFVRFLLKLSKNLERLRINAHVLDRMRRKQLLKFHHGLCQIEIV